MTNALNSEYGTNLTSSALELFSNFSDIMEYDFGCGKESALNAFAFDLYTSSPTLFLNDNLAKGEIDPKILDLVNQCSMSELRKIARVDRGEDSITIKISDKLSAANMLLEGGNRDVNVEDVMELVANASDSLILAINTGNISADLVEKLKNGDFDYDGDEISETLESIAMNPNCACTRSAASPG